jgi:hypothetical protein
LIHWQLYFPGHLFSTSSKEVDGALKVLPMSPH